VLELGGTVVSLSDSHGSLIATEGGFTKEDIESIAEAKLKGGQLHALASSLKGKYAYHKGARPWTLLEKIHIALPCATQNEVSEEEAHALVKAGVKIVAEGSNMGCTQEAVHVFEASRKEGGIWLVAGVLCSVCNKLIEV
jgi:glutamate dehydrogenase (NADP+)